MKFSLPFLWILLLFTSTGFANPVVVDGVLDLRGQSFEHPIDLGGDWEFYWQKHLSPDELDQHAGDKRFLKVPGSWYHDRRHGLPVFGYGTYHLRILIDRPEQLAFAFAEIWSSSRVFLNGREIAAYGQLGPDSESYHGGTGTLHFVFMPDSDVIELTIQTSNFDIFLSGLTRVPSIGRSTVMHNNRDRKLAVDLVVVGALLIMAIYHLCLFALRTEDKSTLCFAMVCFFVASYTATVGSSALITLWPQIPFTWRLRVLNFSWMAATHAFIWFAWILFQPYYQKRVIFLSAWMATVHHLLCLTAEPRVFVNMSVLFEFLVAPVLGYTFWVAWKSRQLKKNASAIFLLGIFVLILAVVNDMLSIHRRIQVPAVGGFGVMAFILVQSYLLAHRFSLAFIKLKRSEREVRDLSENLKQVNENLEITIEDKTRDIRSIMKHIPVGIFIMAGPKGVIARDHSEHLKQILLQDHLEGLEAAQLLFANSQLTEDEKSQAISAIHASLNELEINFDINSSFLPLQIRRQDDQGLTRIYDLTWDKIVNEAGMTEKILVTIRDMTELKGLQMKAQRHQEELEIIGEILNVAPLRFNRFMRSAQDLLAESDKLLKAAASRGCDPDVLKILFINVHTMKGAARSLYFKKMTEVLHEIEQYYAQLKHFTQLDLQRMQADQLTMTQLVERYERIARDKLGRVPTDLMRMDFSMDEVQQHFEQLGQLMQSEAVPSAIKAPVQAMIARFFKRIHTPVKVIMEEICLALPALAKDLEKERPEVDLQDEGLMATHQAEELLHRIFVHLLRNSMDHGIESPEERHQKQKPKTPTIFIRFEWQDDAVTLHYCDDGRGLNINRLRDKALQNHLLTPREAQDPQRLAELLLTSQVSTAQAVTEISGRGVGMGAIRQYVEHIGGHIAIRLIHDTQSDPGFVPFGLKMELPSHFFARSMADAEVKEAS